ncbi:MAG TPA: glycoside hydrolase family 2 TIM barrel-domain containing protein [Candidatus Sulfotelmatobacter sp.]|nr:glycoside hydrolase family 2 TIM barrel-domain containing protein [Candidatus Sulfotelmatobacter sp.]
MIRGIIGAICLGASSYAGEPQAYQPPASHRVDVLLDNGWRFLRQDASGAQVRDFDDSAWATISLPHTWNNLDGQAASTNYYRGTGWYRSHVTVEKGFAGRELFLKFDGAFLVTDVYVNGTHLGEHEGGFADFVFDATPYLKIGEDNVIAVKVNNAVNTNIPPLSADFTFFGGLYRDVHLLVTDPVQISPLDYGSPGVYLKTTAVGTNSADLQVTTVLSNAVASAQTVTLRAVVTDAETNIVTVLEKEVTLSPASASNIVMNTTVLQPHLWDGLADPYLYHVSVELSGPDDIADLVTQPLGFRYYHVDPDKGFFLNGHYLDLHGVSMHQDWISRGWAIGSAERETNFALLKEIGATALRLCHYEHNDETYQLADRNGIVVWSEIPLVNRITQSPGFYASAKQQLTELIRQRYNHPSVICWGVFNEVTLRRGPSPTELARELVQVVKQEDPTRPASSAANSSDTEPSSWCADLIGFNKYFGWYNGKVGDLGAWTDKIHRKNPDRCVGITEYGAGASISQHQEGEVAQPVPTGKFHPEEYQNIYHETQWSQLNARPFIWCKFVWNLCDFAVAARNEGNTPGRNDKGLVTYDRQTRKDAFYYYKANWTTNPMVYITGHTFTNRQACAITAKVYANCDSVELFVNGVSQGGASGTNCIFTWPVTLAGGANAVRAVGHKGEVQVSDSLQWSAPEKPKPSAASAQRDAKAD